MSTPSCLSEPILFLSLDDDISSFQNSHSRSLSSADVKPQMVVLVRPSDTLYQSSCIRQWSKTPADGSRSEVARGVDCEVEWHQDSALRHSAFDCGHFGSVIINSDALRLASEVVQEPDCGVRRPGSSWSLLGWMVALEAHDFHIALWRAGKWRDVHLIFHMHL